MLYAQRNLKTSHVLCPFELDFRLKPRSFSIGSVSFNHKSHFTNAGTPKGLSKVDGWLHKIHHITILKNPPNVGLRDESAAAAVLNVMQCCIEWKTPGGPGFESP